MDSRTIVFLVGLIGSISGLYLIYSGITDWKKAKAIQSWSSTKGVVVSSAVRTNQPYRDKRERASWSPHINYSYRVMGKKYTNSRIGLGRYRGNQGWAASIIQHYSGLSSLIVTYNTDNPNEAVLEVGAPDASWNILLGLVLLGGGIGAVLYQINQ